MINVEILDSASVGLMIAKGSKVLLVDDKGRKHIVTALPEMIEVGGLGVVDGESLCSLSYGDSMRIGGAEFTVMRPSVRDILGIIERRAQIMIPKDSFGIPMYLDVSCGSKIIEGGVGSGALTIVLLKAVGPNGRVCSYETRDDHADLAKRNVQLSENAAVWELRKEDICTAKLDPGFDAAVLDIPNPWDALPNVSTSLRPGACVCCYVPNVNQLDSTVRRMREIGLDEVLSFETIQREMIVHEGGVRPSFDMLGHTGYLAFGRKMS